MNYPPIEDHGIIGNMETAALVCNTGTIDFMCFPNFDSPTVFASLLDVKKGGFFQIEPALLGCHLHQSYRPNTNILDTTFRSAHATAIVSDFMTIEDRQPGRRLVRRVKTVRGEVPFHAVCSPKFGYGQVEHKVERKSGGILFIPENPTLPAMLLRASAPMELVNGAAHSRFRLRAGRAAWFVLEEYPPSLPRIDPARISEALEKTRLYWESWAAQSTYKGRWREMVTRSALTLALLTSKREGSIVAAPTFGLPEWPSASRNWDYRFSWVRDASFALEAFLKLGYTREARALMGWLEHRCLQSKQDKPLQTVYRLNGDLELAERELEHLEGYKASRPVRIGNAAWPQLQLDIYGELMDAVFLYDQSIGGISVKLWSHIYRMADWICQNWEQPDHSIWEIRGRARRFLYSRVMCWVALDKALKLARRNAFSAPHARWRAMKIRIDKSIHSSFWNPRLKSFVQYQNAQTADASLLLLPRMDFIESNDPRWQSTLIAIEKHLIEDCLVYRHRPASMKQRGGAVHEGTFSACSFWYVEALAKGGNLVAGRTVFEKFLGYANELGLFAEQLGPQSEHLGNFPQALSHSSLIRAACDLEAGLSAAKR